MSDAIGPSSEWEAQYTACLAVEQFLRETENKQTRGHASLRLLPAMTAATMKELEARVGKTEQTVTESSIKDQLTRAVVSVSLDEHEAGLALLDAVLKTDPVNFDAWFWKGYALKRLKRIPEAEGAMSKAVSLQPDQARSLYNLACYKTLNGKDNSEILTLLEKSYKVASQDDKRAFFQHFKEDPDLNRLRELPDFQALLKRLAADLAEEVV